MTKRVIIVYNSFAHDKNPHGTLLQRQLAEVNKELLTCDAAERSSLINERRLLQRHIRKAQDGVGTPEEVAYGEGWHSVPSAKSPYSEAQLTAAYEKGQRAAAQAKKFRKNYFKAETRGKRFEPKKVPVNQQQDSKSNVTIKKNPATGGCIVETPEGKRYRFGSAANAVQFAQREATRLGCGVKNEIVGTQYDYKTELGFVGIIYNDNGSQLEKSDPMISRRSAERWVQERAAHWIAKGKRVTGSTKEVRYDPALGRDVKAPKYRRGQTVTVPGSNFGHRGKEYRLPIKDIDVHNGEICYIFSNPEGGNEIWVYESDVR